MPLTIEQRRENMARARAARRPKEGAEGIDAALKPKRTAADSGSTPDASTTHDEPAAVIPIDLGPVSWVEDKQVLFQCLECRAAFRGLHPKHWEGRPNMVECPNRMTKHFGQSTPLDYTP